MSVTLITWSELDESARRGVLQRPAVAADASIRADVRKIIDAVRKDGDAAVKALTLKLDGAELDQLRVSDEEIAVAESELDAEALDAIDLAIANVRRFHKPQLPQVIEVETMPGVRCQRVSHPLDAVGLYVPAGTAPLPSAAIMLAVPADIAGSPVRVMCTQPRPDGNADPAVIVAANRAGITDIYKVGGAQAIAAMAYGTETVPKVCKVFGPGNAWVTSAKTLVSADAEGAAMDLPAGPSEVLVIADEAASATFVASDLLSQAEHGTDSQVVLVTTSTALAAGVMAELEQQLARLPRADIAAAALEHSRVIVVDDLDTAIEVSNRYAPEHLILQCRQAADLLSSIRNAGSVFVGEWTPESVGDYCSGTNHVLPTYGFAQNYSGLGVDQFMRQMTIQELSRDGLQRLGGAVIRLAELEGLDAHAQAVSLRLENGA